MSDEFEQAIGEIAGERRSGATELARRALGVEQVLEWMRETNGGRLLSAPCRH